MELLLTNLNFCGNWICFQAMPAETFYSSHEKKLVLYLLTFSKLYIFVCLVWVGNLCCLWDAVKEPICSLNPQFECLNIVVFLHAYLKRESKTTKATSPLRIYQTQLNVSHVVLLPLFLLFPAPLLFFINTCWSAFFNSHLNRDKIESNLSVPGIQGCHENALIKSFEMSPHLICL